MIKVIAAIVMIVAAATGCSGGDDDGGGEYGARDVCQQFVEDRLKSPGSADFSSEEATESADGSWVVTGDVDSDNSFGASIRNTYECTVRYDPGTERWTLEDLDSTEN